MADNLDLSRRRSAAVPRGVASVTAIHAAEARNAELWDVEGKRYIDFAGGIGVLNVGHCHPRVIAAAERQLRAFTHSAFQVAPYESYIALAERLNALAPVDGPAKTIFFTTGAEATENAVKIARVATGRPAVIAFSGAFHGRTLLASAMTGKVKPYKLGFGPFPSDVYHVPFPSPVTGVSVEDSLRAIELLFRADLDATSVAAIIIEPIQGEGGFHVAPSSLLQALRALCDRYGILLIADEVQTGFARTGRMFCIEHSGVAPDMLTIAKSLAGGFPLSGVIGRADIMDAVEPGGLGGTFGGSPVGCAAALEVLAIIEDEDLIARADAIGDRLRERIAAWSVRNDLVPIAGVRGYGAMIGFDVVTGRGESDPDGAEAKSVCTRALEAGLILLTCGAFGEAIRILVPLTVSDETLAEGLDLLETALVPTAAIPR